MKRPLMWTMILMAVMMFVASMRFSINGGFKKCDTEIEAPPISSADQKIILGYAEPMKTSVTKLMPKSEKSDMTNSNIETEVEVMYYTEDEVAMMAKLLYRECRGIQSDTEKACVAWCVCNRVDSDEFYGDTISEVITAPNQFSYSYSTPVEDTLYELALDVLTRWNSERNGEVSVGRVLPKDYTFFSGDGAHNHFRNAYRGSYSIWDYSFPSPYES